MNGIITYGFGSFPDTGHIVLYGFGQKLIPIIQLNFDLSINTNFSIRLDR